MERTGESYWEASRRVRETFARHQLANVLLWAFLPYEQLVPGGDDDELEVFLSLVCEWLPGIDSAWAMQMEAMWESLRPGARALPLARLRAELEEGLAVIRNVAGLVAQGDPSQPIPVQVALSIPASRSDRDGKPRWAMTGRFRDALIWAAVKLFSEVPRSLVRICERKDCSRVFVGIKNQKFCSDHQAEAARQAQRRAERTHRERERAKKGKKQ